LVPVAEKEKGPRKDPRCPGKTIVRTGGRHIPEHTVRTGLVFDPGPQPSWLLARSVLHRSPVRSQMLFWEGRWVGDVLGMGLCKSTI